MRARCRCGALGFCFRGFSQHQTWVLPELCNTGSLQLQSLLRNSGLVLGFRSDMPQPPMPGCDLSHSILGLCAAAELSVACRWSTRQLLTTWYLMYLTHLRPSAECQQRGEAAGPGCRRRHPSRRPRTPGGCTAVTGAGHAGAHGVRCRDRRGHVLPALPGHDARWVRCIAICWYVLQRWYHLSACIVPTAGRTRQLSGCEPDSFSGCPESCIINASSSCRVHEAIVHVHRRGPDMQQCAAVRREDRPPRLQNKGDSSAPLGNLPAALCKCFCRL